MKITEAYIILGVEKDASLAEIESARRKLLQVLHPDKHSIEQKEFFEIRTRNVVEAAKLLKANLKRVKGVKTRQEPLIEESHIRDNKLMKAIIDALSYGPTLSSTPTLNLVQMLKSVGESCCETEKARQLFADMLAHSQAGARIDYNKVRVYLEKG